jgi:hypothetical protein
VAVTIGCPLIHGRYESTHLASIHRLNRWLFGRVGTSQAKVIDDGQPDLPSGGHAELPSGGQLDYLV